MRRGRHPREVRRIYLCPVRTKRQRRAETAFERAALALAGGVTVTPGRGAWRAPDGRIFREPIRELLIVAHPIAARKVARAFCQFGRSAGERALMSIPI